MNDCHCNLDYLLPNLAPERPRIAQLHNCLPCSSAETADQNQYSPAYSNETTLCLRFLPRELTVFTVQGARSKSVFLGVTSPLFHWDLGARKCRQNMVCLLHVSTTCTRVNAVQCNRKQAEGTGEHHFFCSQAHWLSFQSHTDIDTQKTCWLPCSQSRRKYADNSGSKGDRESFLQNQMFSLHLVVQNCGLNAVYTPRADPLPRPNMSSPNFCGPLHSRISSSASFFQASMLFFCSCLQQDFQMINGIQAQMFLICEDLRKFGQRTRRPWNPWCPRSLWCKGTASGSEVGAMPLQPKVIEAEIYFVFFCREGFTSGLPRGVAPG